MNVEMRRVEEVRPYPDNPRVLSPEAIQAVANSIRAFGFRQPIVVDEEGVVIAGHMRLAAAVTLGLDEVPVHVADSLTEDEARAYRLADNSTADLGQWDLSLRLGEMQAIDLNGFAVDWSDFGLVLPQQEEAGEAGPPEKERVSFEATRRDPDADEGEGHTCPSCGFRW